MQLWFESLFVIMLIYEAFKLLELCTLKCSLKYSAYFHAFADALFCIAYTMHTMLGYKFYFSD